MPPLSGWRARISTRERKTPARYLASGSRSITPPGLATRLRRLRSRGSGAELLHLRAMLLHHRVHLPHHAHHPAHTALHGPHRLHAVHLLVHLLHLLLHLAHHRHHPRHLVLLGTGVSLRPLGEPRHEEDAEHRDESEQRGEHPHSHPSCDCDRATSPERSTRGTAPRRRPCRRRCRGRTSRGPSARAFPSPRGRRAWPRAQSARVRSLPSTCLSPSHPRPSLWPPAWRAAYSPRRGWTRRARHTPSERRSRRRAPV